ncbi:MAG: 4-hydroxybenzoate octaprenyltransferase [Zoogloeaceae bacterium]|nr:4-hydroxybenzoate octaprenyltransferase [Zoogloeaceae bacterium]
MLRLNEYEKLMRLDKPIGSLLLLWPTLWALWLSAAGRPTWTLVWVFVLGTVLMRSAGCVINDYADRDFDPHVERTRERPLAARRIKPREALWLAAGLVLFAFLLLLPFLTRTLFFLGLVAVFLALSYPFTKRFFAIPQAWLGVAYGFGVPMAYAAQQGHVPLEGWLLLVANIFWTVAFDTEYAMVDRPDDLKIGIKTSAITFGRFDVLAIMCCYAIAFILLTALGLYAGLGFVFLAFIGIACGLAYYHYRLIRARQGAACFKAFLHNNWVGATLFAGIALDYLARGVLPF